MDLKKKSELIESSLNRLRIVAEGESVAAHDFALVKSFYDDLWAELRDLGLAYWPNSGDRTDEIPAAVFRPLVHIVAHDIGPDYGKVADPIMDNDGQMVTGRVYGLRQLRKHIRKTRSGEQTSFSVY